MKTVKYQCDSCHKEILGAPFSFNFPGFTSNESSFDYKPNTDLCDECYVRLRKEINIS